MYTRGSQSTLGHVLLITGHKPFAAAPIAAPPASMSLFSSREWWTARLGDSEEFDQNSLVVANIDNEPSGAGERWVAAGAGGGAAGPCCACSCAAACLQRTARLPDRSPPRLPPAAKLVTGSLQGVLRVHKPHGRDYRVEDCLLEVQLEAGILQLAVGRFAGGCVPRAHTHACMRAARRHACNTARACRVASTRHYACTSACWTGDGQACGRRPP